MSLWRLPSGQSSVATRLSKCVGEESAWKADHQREPATYYRMPKVEHLPFYWHGHLIGYLGRVPCPMLSLVLRLAIYAVKAISCEEP